MGHIFGYALLKPYPLVSLFADIAFPTAVRQLFTYEIPKEFFSYSLLGKRVWVPYRNSYSIGVIVRIHNEIPKFKIKTVKKNSRSSASIE